jgi:hypothetical protein
MQTNDENEYLRPSRVLKGMPEIKEDGFRRPAIREAAQYFRITGHVTIYNWWVSQAVGLYSSIRRCPQSIETHKDPPKLLEHTRSFPASPKLLEYTQSFSTEASRIYSVILQRQSLDYIRHALNIYFRFPFFLSFLKFEILVNKESPIAIKLPTPLTLSQTSVNRHTLNNNQSVG